MSRIRRILVAVGDTESKSHPAITKAAQLARALGAQLELFHGIEVPLSAGSLGVDPLRLTDARRNIRAHALARLERLAERVRKDGIAVRTSAEWDFPAFEAIIRQALHSGADLIVADCRGRHRAAWLLRLTDWELLRHSPVPVLLVKSARSYRHPAVLAAVDPTHSFAKPTRLDEQILRMAAELARPLRGTLHAIHAYYPAVLGTAPVEWVSGEVTSEILSQARKVASHAVDRTIARLGLSEVRKHVVNAPAFEAIRRTAQQTGSRIVVIGAVSRSGLKRLLIGNTAERLLDELASDVLIVKPRQFVSGVQRSRRGMRAVAASPLAA